LAVVEVPQLDVDTAQPNPNAPRHSVDSKKRLLAPNDQVSSGKLVSTGRLIHDKIDAHGPESNWAILFTGPPQKSVRGPLPGASEPISRLNSRIAVRAVMSWPMGADHCPNHNRRREVPH
jgi:hypothetical protein